MSREREVIATQLRAYIEDQIRASVFKSAMPKDQKLEFEKFDSLKKTLEENQNFLKANKGLVRPFELAKNFKISDKLAKKISTLSNVAATNLEKTDKPRGWESEAKLKEVLKKAASFVAVKENDSKSDAELGKIFVDFSHEVRKALEVEKQLQSPQRISGNEVEALQLASKIKEEFSEIYFVESDRDRRKNNFSSEETKIIEDFSNRAAKRLLDEIPGVEKFDIAEMLKAEVTELRGRKNFEETVKEIAQNNGQKPITSGDLTSPKIISSMLLTARAYVAKQDKSIPAFDQDSSQVFREVRAAIAEEDKKAQTQKRVRFTLPDEEDENKDLKNSAKKYSDISEEYFLDKRIDEVLEELSPDLEKLARKEAAEKSKKKFKEWKEKTTEREARREARRSFSTNVSEAVSDLIDENQKRGYSDEAGLKATINEMTLELLKGAKLQISSLKAGQLDTLKQAVADHIYKKLPDKNDFVRVHAAQMEQDIKKLEAQKKGGLKGFSKSNKEFNKGLEDQIKSNKQYISDLRSYESCIGDYSSIDKYNLFAPSLRGKGIEKYEQVKKELVSLSKGYFDLFAGEKSSQKTVAEALEPKEKGQLQSSLKKEKDTEKKKVSFSDKVEKKTFTKDPRTLLFSMEGFHQSKRDDYSVSSDKEYSTSREAKDKKTKLEESLGKEFKVDVRKHTDKEGHKTWGLRVRENNPDGHDKGGPRK